MIRHRGMIAFGWRSDGIADSTSGTRSRCQWHQGGTDVAADGDVRHYLRSWESQPAASRSA